MPSPMPDYISNRSAADRSIGKEGEMRTPKIKGSTDESSSSILSLSRPCPPLDLDRLIGSLFRLSVYFVDVSSSHLCASFLQSVDRHPLHPSWLCLSLVHLSHVVFHRLVQPFRLSHRHPSILSIPLLISPRPFFLAMADFRLGHSAHCHWLLGILVLHIPKALLAPSRNTQNNAGVIS